MPEDKFLSQLLVDIDVTGNELIPILDVGATPPNKLVTINTITAETIAAHKAEENPHPEYLTNTEVISLYVPVRNNSGATIGKGVPVYPTGSSGTTITIAPADASAAATASRTLGLTCESIPNNTNGLVIAVGPFEGLNTSTLTEGAIIYLSETTGAMTTTRPPAPAHSVVLGYCIKQASGTAGIVDVKVDNGLELDELHDVLIAGKTPGQAFIVAANGLWQNRFLLAADLSDAGATGLDVIKAANQAAARTALGLGSASTAAATEFAPAAQGVSGGNAHDHNGGDGAQIDYNSLSSLPTLGTAAAANTTDFAPAAQGVSGGNAHDHNGGDGAQIAYGSLSGLPTLPAAANVAPQPLGAVATIGTSPQYALADHGHQRDTTLLVINLSGSQSDPVAANTIERFRFQWPAQILESALSAETAAAGSAFEVNARLNTSSIYSVRPQIAIGNTSGTSGTLAITTAAAGDILRFDISQAAGGCRNAQLYLTVRRIDT
jgi:hypothetical protein